MYESGWVAALRVLAKVFLVIGVIGSGFIAVFVAREHNWDTGAYEVNPILFLVVFIAMALGVVVSVIVVMVFAEIATNTEATAQTNLKILEHLERQNKPAVSTKPSTTCTKCQQIYDMTFGHCPHCGFRDNAKKTSLSSLAAKHAGANSSGWICAACEDANLATSRTCKGCGRER
ncbi:MAG: hypothetical protein FWC78_04255 [Defluviitaleaceae bacterium]|nr:hypothetical protein [Defluviitaleaceae bacterium]